MMDALAKISLSAFFTFAIFYLVFRYEDEIFDFLEPHVKRFEAFAKKGR